MPSRAIKDCRMAGGGAPAPGKRFVKAVKGESGRTRHVSYGQAGQAKGGGDRIRPGTSKGDAYCARSAGINRQHPKAARDPNSPNNLSRRKWKCVGERSAR